jgi:plasmid stabilization system protein ParE
LIYKLHPGAAGDVAEAARFYRREGGSALAARFMNEFDRVAKMLVSNPGLGSLTDENHRWFPLYDFPFSIIYHASETGVHILVVRHHRRDPDFGNQRR